MKLEEAVDLLTILSGKSKDTEVNNDIEDFIGYILNIDEKYPFSHPIHWASFYVTGASHLDFVDRRERVATETVS